MKKQFLVAGFVFLCCFSPVKAYAAKFTSLYVFGDSLSDTGNIFTATGGAIPPSPPYFEGRFSNGEIWVDKLADKLGLESPTLVTKLQPGVPTNGINYAFGGATTTDQNTIALTPSFGIPEPLQPQLLSLEQQIQAFTAQNQSADPNALYILWAGSNDYNITEGTFTPFTDTDTTINNLDNALANLATTGVKNVMLINLANLGDTPLARRVDTSLIPGTTQRLNDLTAKHNQELSGLVDKYQTNLNIIPVDVNSLFKNASLDFTNAIEPCLASLDPLIVCNNPNEYVFWDLQHPTTVAHERLADLAFKSIPKHEKVPEPGNMMGLVGLGAVGIIGAVKRKQKKSSSIAKNPLLAVTSSVERVRE